MAKGKVFDWIDPLTNNLREEKKALLSAWCKDGLTEKEISEEMGISRSTLNEWKKKYPDISDTMKRTRAYAHARVENSLFNRACGYTIPIRKQFKVKKPVWDEKKEKILGWEESLEERSEDLHIPADTKAIIFYLKNRIPEKWKEKIPEAEENEENNTGLVFMQSLEQILKKKKNIGEIKGKGTHDDTGGDIQGDKGGGCPRGTVEK